MGKESADRVLYVTDAGQASHFQQVFQVCVYVHVCIYASLLRAVCDRRWSRLALSASVSGDIAIPYTLNHTPYALYPIPYTLLPTPYALYPKPYSLYPIPYTLNPTPYTLYPKPYSLYPIP